MSAFSFPERVLADIPATLEALNRMNQGNMGQHLGIEYTAIGSDFLEARLPVDHRTHQPFGLLHGGASVVLAESLGSVAAYLCVDGEKQACVGLEINANHLRGVRNGFVTGRATPLHVGRSTQVWQIHIRNEAGEMVCASRITLAVIDKKP